MPDRRLRRVRNVCAVLAVFFAVLFALAALHPHTPAERSADTLICHPYQRCAPKFQQTVVCDATMNELCEPDNGTVLGAGAHLTYGGDRPSRWVELEMGSAVMLVATVCVLHGASKQLKALNA